MKKIADMMKAAHQMQARMTEAQEALAAMEITGRAGAGMIEVTLSGKGDLKNVRIDPAILKPEDVEMVKDLFIAAFNDAKTRVDEVAREKMGEVTGGLKLPEGMGMPF